ncbi:polyamine aminopropyltransferase [Myceligenerans crystallogenes]|uniref:Polyamine aminopropyltransferase n=1 Tax=Myceligenerans crystallogenes TaxID=316335 RepID=A0ABN2NJF2_9MICO
MSADQALTSSEATASDITPPDPTAQETASDTTAQPPLAAGRPRLARAALLAVVFVCAACGLVYELALVALGSYLLGDTAGQASVVLSVMVFAMGIGALAAKGLQARAAASFVVVELLLALLGGLSVLGLYAAFAWLHLYTVAVVVVAFVLGALIGAEIPLLMVLLQRIRAQDAGSAVADLFAADYVGALLGGLAFPFLLLPMFGQLQGAIVVGVVNAAAGIVLVFTLLRRDLSRRVRAALVGGAVVVGGILGLAWITAGQFETTARQALFRDPVVHAERTRYQELVLTENPRWSGDRDLRLFLDGDLQFSSADEHRYHEALVHPAMAGGPRERVLVLGGGDGLALREVLRYDDVERATLVELDPAMIALARGDLRLSGLNGGAFDDPRVTVVADDAFRWLREEAEPGAYDVVVVDMPDPDQTATAKLYSIEFYSLAERVLAPQGRLVVQSGSPYFAPRSYWCVATTLQAAGFATTPYHVDVPSFGDWGFHLAVAGRGAGPELAVDAPAPLRFLDQAVLSAAAVFPPDRAERTDVEVTTILDPVILEYQRAEWREYS